MALREKEPRHRCAKARMVRKLFRECLCCASQSSFTRTPKSSPQRSVWAKGSAGNRATPGPATSRESLTGDTARRCHHAPSTRWDRSTRARARTIGEQPFRRRLGNPQRGVSAPRLRRHHPRQPGMAYLATAKVYSDIEAVEIVFKDGGWPWLRSKKAD